MAMIPALKLLADPDIEDVRPIILGSVTDNEFSVETCVEICTQIIKAKDQHQRELAQQPAKVERAISLHNENQTF
jgi:hypothetical protein